ncbi:hypothetical protein [Devosia alba]|uniref:hypothetical protein n=1 Tax=Devosia alba TaxID=3152360 RepID=UPI00326790D0
MDESVLTPTIREAAALRGRRQFAEAMHVIEDAMVDVPAGDDLRVNAWREAFLAAVEGGTRQQAEKYARLIAETDPDMPSIRPYL